MKGSSSSTAIILALVVFVGVFQAAADIDGKFPGTEQKTRWAELTYNNFEDTIQAHEFTCVLMYDPLDERSLKEHTWIMEEIYDRMEQRRGGESVGFARLNQRQHTKLREIYTRSGYDVAFAKEYYEFSPNDPYTMTNETLLDVSLGTPYWPSQFLLLARNYNMYDYLEAAKIKGDSPLKVRVLDKWLTGSTTDKNLIEMKPVIQTRANKEKDMKFVNERYGDNTFDFETYDAYQAALKKIKDKNSGGKPPAPRNIRLLLETGSKDDGRKSSKGPFSYGLAWVKEFRTSQNYLEELGRVIEDYLAWAEGYETTWSKERKAREDQQTNFGYFLKEMDKDIHALLNRLFRENPKIKLEENKAMREVRKREDYSRRMKVPNLKPYFEEAVFGSGRSVTSWRKVMDDMKAKLGETAEERRQNRYSFNTTTIPIVPRLREYFSVLSEVTTKSIMIEGAEKDEIYNIVLADLFTSWHNILTDFHEGLSQYYVRYWLTRNPRPNGNKFQMGKLDIIDMKEPKNKELLSNYDYFHGNYTKRGTPVILSNVELTAEAAFSLEYIVSQCSATPVTSSVKVSHKVGEKQGATVWGGLDGYVLDDELMNESRQKEKKNRKKRAITMEQFTILAERLDHLYLHDFSLAKNCDTILFGDTPYSRNQKFKIPSMIGGWDLFQRMQTNIYLNSWPSLFIGKKGSNSKLHIDNGATGFFMYLVSGRKRWVIYNREERPFLYKKILGSSIYPDVLGIGKDEESDQFLSERFPLLHRAEGAYEIIQEPGQLVYIPPSCPHAVENLEDTIGLAMNFVTRDGMANHLHYELHRNRKFAVIDAAMNYWFFEDDADKPISTEDPLYTTYGEYKAQY